MKKELVKLHHARSAKDFPELRLEENEYVELAIQRSYLGLVFIWAAACTGYVALLVAIVFLAVGNAGSANVASLNGFAKSYLYLIILILFGIITISALVGTRVYKGNRLYVTNKRLIHHQTNSLFSKSVNVIELVSIEDVSFKQENIGDHIFKLGTIRMSTVGDETTYTFKYVNTPKEELDMITHLVHMEKEKTKRRQRLAMDDNFEDDIPEEENIPNPQPQPSH
ncbi:PH domain-containing protein [Candidatus Saccharibacteria bacterium]|nr:PH domain-containing protein [Candidatus Saccharibacteria bacterium]MBR3233910.1 PH domain-containing protein [Candidatus Saccharibacteria bacterium]